MVYLNDPSLSCHTRRSKISVSAVACLMRSFLLHENRVSMCDMDFQWYSLHPSISSSTSRSTAPRLRPVRCGQAPVTWIVSASQFCQYLSQAGTETPMTREQTFVVHTKNSVIRHHGFQRQRSRGGHGLFSAFFGLYAAPKVTLTCDEMNCTVDCFVRCSRCVTSKLEDVRIFASNQSHAKLRFGTAVIGWFSIVLKSVVGTYRTGWLLRFSRDVSTENASIASVVTHQFFSASRAADRVLRFSTQDRSRIHRTGFPHATKTFRSTDQCA